MKVHEAIALLQRCDPDAVLVAPLAFQGMEEITSLERKHMGGVGVRMSFEEISVVVMMNGNVEYMQSCGLDVLGVPSLASPSISSMEV